MISMAGKTATPSKPVPKVKTETALVPAKDTKVPAKRTRGKVKRIKKAIKGKASLKTTEIPPMADPNEEEVEFYSIREPYTYVRITLNKKTHEYVYNAIEPQLTGDEQDAFDFIKKTFVDRVDFMRKDVDEKLLNEVDKKVLKRLEKEYGNIEKALPKYDEYKLRGLMNKLLDETGKEFSAVSREKIFYYCMRTFMGYGLIDIMMQDPQLEDVSCDGNNVPLYVFHRRFKNIKTNIKFQESEDLEAFVILLAQMSGKSISIANPVLDATLPDGSRLNQTLGTEVTTRGSSFTIRKFKEDPLTITDLVNWRTMSPEMAAHLWLAVQYGESMMCSGGTASGKTTTLNAVSHFIPPSAKIITIEDTREMNLPHENWIAGLTREKKGEQAGQSIDMFTLLTAALRQRPEYMIVGEVRGKETMTVFQAMATGQTTYSTIHADSVASIVHRLENPPINIPRILIMSLNLVILQAQVKVKNKRTRRIKELCEIIGIEPTTNEVVTNSVYKWAAGKDEFKYTGHSKMYEKIMEQENLTSDEVLEEVERRKDIIIWLCKKNIRRHIEVASIVNEYYRDPDGVIKRVRSELQQLEHVQIAA